MRYRMLGRTGLKVSEVGFGAWAIGGPAELGGTQIGWGDVDDGVSIRAVHAALDAGVNFIDTADSYGCGHSEEVLAKALGGRRDEVIIATKFGSRIDPTGNWVKDFSGGWIPQAVEASLTRLETDYIDLIQCHSPWALEALTDDTFAALETLRDAGKIRHVGVSVKQTEHGVPILRRWPQVEVIQVVYNILSRQPETDLLPLAQERNVGIIGRVPLASGFLTGKFAPDVTFPENDHRRRSYPPEKARRVVEAVEKLRFLERDGTKSMAQAALQFCLSHLSVSTVIPGGKTPEQAGDNAAASDGVLLTEDELARIRADVTGDLAGTTVSKK